MKNKNKSNRDRVNKGEKVFQMKGTFQEVWKEYVKLNEQLKLKNLWGKNQPSAHGMQTVRSTKQIEAEKTCDFRNIFLCICDLCSSVASFPFYNLLNHSYFEQV